MFSFIFLVRLHCISFQGLFLILFSTLHIYIQEYSTEQCCGSGFFGSLVHKQTPVNLLFSIYIIVYDTVLAKKNYFKFWVALDSHYNQVIKCHYKFVLLKIKKVGSGGDFSRPDPVWMEPEPQHSGRPGIWSTPYCIIYWQILIYIPWQCLKCAEYIHLPL